MSEVDFVIKVRDGAQLIVDACQEYLEAQAPREEKPTEKGKDPYGDMQWQQGEGAKGPYEMVKADGSDLFRNLLARLEQNQGRLSLDTFYYWVGSRGDTIFRRKKRGQ